MLRLSVFAGGVLFVSACIAPGPGVPPAVPLPQSALRHTPAPPAYWPTHGWRYSAPEEQGVSSRALSEVVRFVLDSGLPVHNLFVVRHGLVVLDVSFYPFQAGTRHDIAYQ